VKGFFQKIFSTSSNPVNDQETRPVPQDLVETPAEPVYASALNPPQLLAVCAQSVGLQRDHNEDAMFALTTTLTTDHTNLPFGLYIVADGMGGHQHGEVASGIAARSMASYIINKLFAPLLSVKPITPEDSLQEIMQSGVQEAHRAITRQVPGGGTTLTAVLILGEQMVIAHVGDSRAYAISPDGKMETLTRDHSLVRRLEELGQISHEEAANHPQRNVLYRALGQGEPFDPDVKSMRLPDEGYLLLCSDGLWGVVPESELSQLIINTNRLDHTCQALVDSANAAGGPDNITAILIRLPGPLS
jgi:serine/threonine protein phosphatase PrpC